MKHVFSFKLMLRRTKSKTPSSVLIARVRIVKVKVQSMGASGPIIIIGPRAFSALNIDSSAITSLL